MKPSLTILITRPAHQTKNLIAELKNLGVNTLSLPTIAILPANNNESLLKAINALNQFDLAIFTSANAVHYAMRYWPHNVAPSLMMAAIGPATAQALQSYNINVDLQPSSPYSSETLLQLPALQNCDKKRIVIFTGEESRQLISDTLMVRGAEVSVAICYRRALPTMDVTPIIRAWDTINIIVITSVASLINLNHLVGKQINLADKTFLVSSERIANAAKTLGFHNIIFAANATDEAIINSLKKYLINSNGH